jgi:hypothetical protein
MSKDLTWDELADIYGKETGGRARIQPMDKIFKWAESRPDLFTYDNDSLQLRVKTKPSKKPDYSILF